MAGLLPEALGLQWQPNDRHLLYASFTRGFRSGAYNSRVLVTSNTPAALALARRQAGPVEPERVGTLEAGLKSLLRNGRLRLALAAFRAEYDDIQRTVAVSVPEAAQAIQLLTNAARARVEGIEVELVLQATEPLTLAASAG